jgi:hypothetical protein
MPSKMKTCEDYRAALTDAAAAAVEPSLELRSHLDACASCRAAFAEEAQLFAAIDLGVGTAANAEVPVSLLPRVRVQLNEQRVPHRAWVPAGAVMAAAVAIVAVLVFFHYFGHDAAGPNPQVNSVAHNVSPAEIQSIPPTPAPYERSAPPAKNKAVRSVSTQPALRVEEVAVLIPAGQKRAMEALLASVQAGKVDGEVLLAEKPEKSLEELQISPLDFSPIEMKPLATAGTELPSQNEETNR